VPLRPRLRPAAGLPALPRSPGRRPAAGARARGGPVGTLPAVSTSLEKTRMKILLLEGVHERAVENFARHGYTTIERHKKALVGEDLKDALAGVHFVGI